MEGVLLVLIAVTCLFSWKGFNDQSFFTKYMFHIGAIKSGDKKRIFTSALLHGDLAHLAFNMYSLYMFAPIVIYIFGDIKFVLVYLASILMGSLLSLEFNKTNYNYTAIGASGGVVGVIYCAILLYPDMNLRLFFIPIDIPAYIFAIAYLAFSVFGIKKNIGNVGHDAHIGGAIGGILITALFNFSAIINNIKLVALMLIPIVVMFAMHKSGKLK